MKLRTTRILAIIGITATVLGATAGTASASVVRQPAPRTAKARALVVQRVRCNNEIDRRLFVLGLAGRKVGQVRHLTDAQRAAERAVIDAVAANLRNVNRPAVNHATTKTALTAACSAIYRDNRVYAVVIPQLFLTVRADQLADLGDALDAKIAEARTAGKDTAAVEATAAEARTHLDAAITALAGVTVGRYNADPAGVRATFRQAQTDLETAHRLGLQAKAALAAL